MNQTGLDWTGSHWTGSDRTRLDQIGLDQLVGPLHRGSQHPPRDPEDPVFRSPLPRVSCTMFGKKCFTIEALVGKDAHAHTHAHADEPIRPTALRFPESRFPESLLPESRFPGLFSRFPGPADAGLPEPGPHAHAHALQMPPPPQGFFSPQHRDALSFYPWVLRSRFLGHRFQGEPGGGGGGGGGGGDRGGRGREPGSGEGDPGEGVEGPRWREPGLWVR
ncbi:unnamed protein product [Menidia menidia]|uniref:(Atlantic silverside) hypothetical protein n=1 Tax=Menidia menidia TaxID=238744 RepID=A0A8S4BLT1_9TELE|nr:unnamed protein product [Menidia menidia]